MKYLAFITFLILSLHTNAQHTPDAILGKWESEQKNLIVEVYKNDDAFKARVVWFANPGNKLPETDIKNPDENLRSRNIVGMDVLSDLMYNEKQDKWTGGKIYDCTTGKTWDASVWLSDMRALNVRGYYLVRWLGKTMNFSRIDN